MPSLYLIDSNGVVRMVESGYTEKSIDEMDKMLRTLLESLEGSQQ
jgi:hypothetical protein